MLLCSVRDTAPEDQAMMTSSVTRAKGKGARSCLLEHSEHQTRQCVSERKRDRKGVFINTLDAKSKRFQCATSNKDAALAVT